MKRTAIFIFLLVAGIYTTMLNSWNAKYFGLQAATIAGLAEHNQFDLIDQVIPGFNLVEGDETFRYGKRIYPMKQPGQTILGSAVYYPLYKLNINFVNHYDYTVHLITFFTSTIMMAGVAVLIYLLTYKAVKSQRVAIVTTLTAVFGTIIWPYAGVMHHDIYATFFVTAAIFSYFWYRYLKQKAVFLILTGFLMGITLFFSMLPVTMPIGLLLIIAGQKKWREISLYLSGLTIGLLPSFIFNYSQFGNILSFPNLAGRVTDTIPFWSIGNFLSHFYFYLLSPTYSLFVYSPVLVFAAGGLLLIPRKYVEAKKALLLLPILLLIHISTQETYGDYQYGPRYLLPILPLISLGTVYFLSKVKNRYWRILFYFSLAYSIAVAAIGSLQTVMYPVSPNPFLEISLFGPAVLLQAIRSGNLPEFRMMPIGIFFIILALGYIVALNKKSKEGYMDQRKYNQQ